MAFKRTEYVPFDPARTDQPAGVPVGTAGAPGDVSAAADGASVHPGDPRPESGPRARPNRESAGDAIPPLDERWPGWATNPRNLAWLASFAVGVFLGVLLRR